MVAKKRKLLFTDTIRSVVSGKYLGPEPTFSELHVSRALQIIGEKEPIGRTILGRELGLGGGAVRTLISRMKRSGLIETKTLGCILSARGRNLYEQLSKKIPRHSIVEGGRLSTGKYTSAILVKKASEQLRLGLEQRDAAIKSGANSATTIIYRNDKFTFPMDTDDCEKKFPDKIWNTLKTVLSPRDNDVIIVSSGESKITAHYGAFAAAWTLLK
jgi:hypothetical protein